MAGTRMMEPTADTTACEVTAFYNGACPVCGREIRSYARYADREKLPMGWVDIDAEPDALAARGLTADDVKRRMHAVDADGNLYRSIDAFLLMWRTMPRYRWLARIVGLPGIKQICWAGYEGVLAPIIYSWDKRRMRRRAAR